ncbi:MAG: HAD family hydrolase [Candidatus Bathyarchaeota archaeon]|jgi:HAD superfamily hydrolase (TIGR01549 family)
MMGKEIKGIIFDLDGTLIHSVIDFTSMKKRMIGILETKGVPEGLLTPLQTTVVILATSEEILRENKLPVQEWERIMGSIEEIMNQGELEAIPKIQEIEGAATTLEALRKAGYKLAILTRSHHAYAVEALKKIGAYDCFEIILGRGETPRPKPHPEALHHAAMLLGFDLDETIFVGDHHIDAQCAKNAGSPFVGVRTGIKGDESWEDDEPETLLDSVTDLPRYLEEL